MLIHLIFTISMLAQVDGAKLGSVQGVVVNSVTGGPVAKATVTIMNQSAPTDTIIGPISGRIAEINWPPPTYATEANSVGAFEFTGVEAGNYILAGNRRGFHLAAATRKSQLLVKVGAGEVVTSIRLAMTPQGIITGRVTDVDGEPFQGAMVSVFKLAPKAAQAADMGHVGDVATDDLGEFRIVDLQPGKYKVVAQPAYFLRGLIQLPESSRSKNGIAQIYQPTYFPGASDWGTAAPVQVVAGRVREGVDIRLTKGRVHRVSGRIIDDSGQPFPSVQVTLQTVGGMVFGATPPSSATNADGSFEIQRVLPGSYVLVSQDQSGYVNMPVDVGDGDVSGLCAARRSTFEINVKFRWDEGEAPAGVESPQVLLQSSVDGQALVGFAQQDTDSSIKELAPGRRKVSIAGLSEKDYVKAILYGGQAITDETIDVRPGADLEVVLRRGTAVVEGKVDNGGDPGPYAMVVLVPALEAKQGAASLYRSAESDTEGKFRIAGIAPGEYMVFALDSVEQGEWLDPDFLTRYKSQGQSLKVEENGKESRTLTLIKTVDH